MLITTLALIIFASFSVVLLNLISTRTNSESVDYIAEIYADELAESSDVKFSFQEIGKRQSASGRIHIVLFDRGFNLVGDNIYDKDYIVTESDIADMKSVMSYSYQPQVVYSKIFKSNIIKTYKTFSAEDGKDYIIKIEMPAGSMGIYAFIIIPILLLIMLFVILFTTRFTKTFVKNVADPLDLIGNALEDYNRNEFKSIEVRSKFKEVDKIIYQLNNFSTKESNKNLFRAVENEKANFLIDYLSVAIIGVDEKLRVTLCNISALNMFKVYKNILGDKAEDFFNDMSIFNRVSDGVINRKPSVFQYSLDGRVYRVEVIMLPNGAISSRAFTAIITFTDTTAEFKAADMRSEFFANASHELKTPVTAVLGFSELLLARSDIEFIRKPIETINKNCIRMHNLIQDMVELSRLDASISSDEDEIIELRDIVDFTVSTVTPIAEKRNIQIFVRGEGQIFGKYSQIEKVVINLIGNAVKYNVDNGKVYVDIDEDGTSVIFKVRDSGRGIPTNDQPRIFERFYCVDKGRTRSSQSTGLGLSIVKHVVSKHGGIIILTSIINVGTQYNVKFPCLNDMLLDEAKDKEIKVYANEKFDIEEDEMFDYKNIIIVKKRIDETIFINEVITKDED